jgi:DNA-binding response OmpR family regulator
MAHLLIVEDDPDVLFTLRTILEEEAHVVQTASTNQHAQEIIRRGGLDLIISDAVLRGDNGDSIVDSAHSLGVPILLISGDVEKIDRLRQTSIACLQKPFTSRTLITTINRLLT